MSSHSKLEVVGCWSWEKLWGSEIDIDMRTYVWILHFPLCEEMLVKLSSLHLSLCRLSHHSLFFSLETLCLLDEKIGTSSLNATLFFVERSKLDVSFFRCEHIFEPGIDSHGFVRCQVLSRLLRLSQVGWVQRSIFRRMWGIGWILVCEVLRMNDLSWFPKQVYLWGSLLEKNRLDTLLGALGLVGRGFGPAGRAGLGWAWGLAVLGALAGLGVGFGRAGRAGWVGRGVWPCWARWLGWAWCWACWARWLGWAWCWAWGLAVLGALAGLGVVLGVGFGRASWVGGVGFGRAGRAGWVGRGVGRVGVVLGVLGALAGLGVLLGVGFGCAWRAGWVGRGVGRRVCRAGR